MSCRSGVAPAPAGQVRQATFGRIPDRLKIFIELRYIRLWRQREKLRLLVDVVVGRRSVVLCHWISPPTVMTRVYIIPLLTVFGYTPRRVMTQPTIIIPETSIAA